MMNCEDISLRGSYEGSACPARPTCPCHCDEPVGRGSNPQLRVGSQPYLAEAPVSGAFRSTTSHIAVQTRLASLHPYPKQAQRHR